MGKSVDRSVYLPEAIRDPLTKERLLLRKFFQADPREPIMLVISCLGGSILDGNALIDELSLLRQHGAVIHGLVQGYAASMAVTILQACTKRYAGPDAVLMTHGATYGVQGDISDVRAEQRLIDVLTERLAQTYGRRTAPLGGRTVAQWRQVFEQNTAEWYSAPDALKAGLIDAVLDDPGAHS